MMTTFQKTLVAELVLSAGFAGGLVVSGRMSLTQPSTAAPGPAAPDQTPATGRTAAALASSSPLPDLSSVAEAALRVSANISSTTTVRRQLTPFDFMFGDTNPVQRSQSLGSGVVVSADGYVLTNTHVIGNAGAEVTVTLPDGIEEAGRLIGIDEISDVAVVKV